MIGNIVNFSNRVGGFIISDIDSTGKQEMTIPAGCKLLCTNCSIENESILTSNGNIIKTNLGYDFIIETQVVINRNSVAPMTILHGREILYCDKVINKNKMVFNLPRGARINQIPVENTGEITIDITNKILIEY